VTTAYRTATPRLVTASTDILPSQVSEPVAGHRLDYWRWVEQHADPDTRDKLLVLRDHWHECNQRYFDGRMLEPYITLTEPSAPQVYGQCCPVSSWGSRLEIRLRPSLLAGTHPHLSGDAAGRTQFVKDVLLHEMIHQHIMEHQPGVNESSYKGHGPVFTAHCNRIGSSIGLADVVVRNRNGAQAAKAAQWPHCVAPASRYYGTYTPPTRIGQHRKNVTASYAIPAGFIASAIGPGTINRGTELELEFDAASGDINGGGVRVVLDVETAWTLAELLAGYFDDDTEEYVQ
jgi:hypothetical protein